MRETTGAGKRFDVLIVGAGHGGAQAAIALRQHKFAGTIGMLGEEPEIPYERPPLSKEYFSGEKTFERIQIRPPAFWKERDIEIVTGTRVVAIDPIHHEAATDAGETIGYGKLIWAAGGVRVPCLRLAATSQACRAFAPAPMRTR